MNKICIIGGAGHIGFPLGLFLASKNNNVYLYDKNKKFCKIINDGQSPHYEKNVKQFILKFKKNYGAGNNKKKILESDVVIVCLGTPVNKDSSPKIKQFLSIIKNLKNYIKQNQLVIIRSSVYPGTIEKVREILKRKTQNIAYCPERILQGLSLVELPLLTQIISGMNNSSINLANRFFKKNITNKIINTSVIEAELIKLFSNALRYIQFATSNEFYMICKSMNISFESIRKKMMLGYDRNKNLYKAGFAAGPCLVKDTMQINSLMNDNFSLGKSALKINQNLPKFIINDLEKKYNLKVNKIGILGMTFKSEVDDIRDSLSMNLIKILKNKKIKFFKSDEYYSDKDTISKEQLIKKSDIIIVAVPHENYKKLKIDKKKIIIDTWQIIKK